MPYVQFQVRRGTTTEWNGTNPQLAAGELGYDTTLKKLKIGDGSNLWQSLEFVNVGPTGPSGGPVGPTGPSGLPGQSGTVGQPGPAGAGWSGGYIRVKVADKNLFATSGADTSTAGSGRSWAITNYTATLTITSSSPLPPTVFGYIAWHTGSNNYKVVNLPYGSSNVDYPRVLITKGNGTWIVTITITESSTFPAASNDANGYAYYIYL